MNTKPATHVRAAFTKDGECKVSARNREFESVQSESRLAAGIRSRQAIIYGTKNSAAALMNSRAVKLHAITWSV
jgi:hypothetical protein